ncbi:hypothetical protein [uncultured Rikenella sp.]|uniref:hypothetical protein n=1 Tax=uncultured Rikenella sp. TaxID=368003 RepID=UPI0026297ABB|nr:hypothetical protein [uncultured Rikenella sp.]
MMTEWLTHISNLLSVLSAAGLLGGGVWMYRRENRRIKQAEAARAEADLNTLAAHEWREIAENREVKINKKDEKIEELYKENREWRDKYNELESQLHRLEVERIKEQIRICNKPKCADREPQSGY